MNWWVGMTQESREQEFEPFVNPRMKENGGGLMSNYSLDQSLKTVLIIRLLIHTHGKDIYNKSGSIANLNMIKGWEN